MIPAADAFALAFQPSYVATQLANRELIDLLALETGNEELARVVAFARKTQKITTESDARKALDQIGKLAARHQIPLPPAPQTTDALTTWAQSLLGAVRAKLGSDPVAGAALEAGRAAGKVASAAWVARNTIYLRAAAPAQPVLVADAARRASDVAAGLTALQEALARRPLPGPVVAIAARLAEHTAKVPDIAAGADADAMKVVFDWGHKLSLMCLELAHAFAAPAEVAVAPATDADAALLREILAHPEDDAPRQRYADLAAGRHDPRGDLINLQLTLAALRGRGPIDMQQATMGKQAAALAAAHPEWTRDVLALGVEAARLHRGFVDEITADAALFLARAEEIYRVAPVLHVRLRKAAGTGAALAASPHLARLRSLSFENSGFGDDDLIALAGSPHLGRLRYLDLTRNPIGARGIEALAGSPLGKQLVYVALDHVSAPSPVDRRQDVSDTQHAWVPTDEGRGLEAKHGPLPWLHPHAAAAWPPGFDQI